MIRTLTGDIISDELKVKAFSLQTIFSGLGAGFVLSVLYFYHFLNVNQDWFWSKFNDIPCEINISF